jgi:hypothetical protein
VEVFLEPILLSVLKCSFIRLLPWACSYPWNQWNDFLKDSIAKATYVQYEKVISFMFLDSIYMKGNINGDTSPKFLWFKGKYQLGCLLSHLLIVSTPANSNTKLHLKTKSHIATPYLTLNTLIPWRIN